MAAQIGSQEIVKSNGDHWLVVKVEQVGEDMYANLGSGEYARLAAKLLTFLFGGHAIERNGENLYFNAGATGAFDGEQSAYQYMVNQALGSV